MVMIETSLVFEALKATSFPIEQHAPDQGTSH